MKNFARVVFSLAAAFAIPSAGAPSADKLLGRVDFTQELGNAVPLTTLVREGGRRLPLVDITRGRPTLLALVYATCPNLCGMTFQGIEEALRDLKWTAGREFEVILLSIDPAEKAENAEEKRRLIENRVDFRRPGTRVHFVSAELGGIQAVARSIGFHYTVDPRSHQYLHPAGWVILTPEGRVSKYFFGVRYSASEVQAALEQAGRRSIGSAARRFLLYCFHYDPRTGTYGRVIMSGLRGLGIIFVLGLGFLFHRLRRRRIHG